jgi:outer membrane phospholipase A
MRLPALLIAVPLAFANAPAAAEWLLAAPETEATAGQAFVVTVVRDESDADQPMPAELQAVIKAGDRTVPVTLVAEGEGGRSRRNYHFDWPADLTGTGVLRLLAQPSSRLLLAAPAIPANVAEAVAQVGQPAQGVAPPPPEPALGFNEPMYFLVGANDGTSARFQLSFRYRLFHAEGSVVGLLPVTRGLVFAYTQTSLWDLHARSKPFRDTSYRPSLFYEWKFPGLGEARHPMALQTGFEHESNGKDGANSRSINTVFARLDWRTPVGDSGAYLGVAPKVWGYADRSDNPDIQRYRGWGELALRAGRDDGWLAALKLRRGEGGRESTQIDLSYPLSRPILADVGAFLHLQFFEGYGETLLDYNERHDPQLRVGFSIVR